MTRRYLVTGGAGFIGAHVARRLLARGHAVRVLDDLSSGRRRAVPAGAEFRRDDIRDAAVVRRAMRGVAGCVHLAAIASVARSVEDPDGTHSVNVAGTRNVFAAARDAGVAVVYASSAAVYGDRSRLPLRETETPRPLSPYAAHKLQNERDAAECEGLSAVGLRFFNVYGPGQDPGSPYSGVISIFAERLLRAQPLTVFGDGAQTRDFVYVGDVVSLILRAMVRVRRAPPVLNVCTGRATSLVQLITALERAAGRIAEVRRGAARPAEIRHSRGSPARATRALGLRPATPLRDGLGALLASL